MAVTLSFDCFQVGDIIYVAGQIALVPGSMQMLEGGISQECRLALRHISRIISAMDQSTLLRDVVQVIDYKRCLVSVLWVSYFSFILVS
jgi:enamine deaminase RidA (YjgF/YER057c/UK114 family)